MILIKSAGGLFSFLGGTMILNTGWLNCDRCNCYLTLLFCSIIDKLHNANLLDKNFRPLCCSCYMIHQKWKKMLDDRN